MKVGCSRLDNGRAVHEKSAVLEGPQDIECAKSHASVSAWVAVADRTRAVFELPNDLQYRRSVQLKLANRSGEQVRFRLCTKPFIAFWRSIAVPSGNDVYGPNVPTLMHPQGHTGAISADENSLVAGIELWR
jgi:hypothetical protein